MESIIGHGIDYSGVGVLRGQRQIPSKNLQVTSTLWEWLPSMSFDYFQNRIVLKVNGAEERILRKRSREGSRFEASIWNWFRTATPYTAVYAFDI